MSTETTTPTRKAAESGVLRFDCSLITYTSQPYGSFSISLSEVAVIGEFIYLRATQMIRDVAKRC